MQNIPLLAHLDMPAAEWITVCIEATGDSMSEEQTILNSYK